MELMALIMAIVFAAAGASNIPPELVLAIIEVESGGNPFAAKMEPNYLWTIPNAKRPAICTQDTEIQMQKTSWGLMQIMGATARDVGFDGWLPQLVDAEVNVTTGCKILRRLMDKYIEKFGLVGVIAAYNRGHPKRAPDGKYANQSYVNSVKSAMKKYKKMIEDDPELLKQLAESAESPENEQPGDDKADKTGDKKPQKDKKPQEGKKRPKKE